MTPPHLFLFRSRHKPGAASCRSTSPPCSSSARGGRRAGRPALCTLPFRALGHGNRPCLPCTPVDTNSDLNELQVREHPPAPELAPAPEAGPGGLPVVEVHARSGPGHHAAGANDKCKLSYGERVIGYRCSCSQST